MGQPSYNTPVEPVLIRVLGSAVVLARCEVVSSEEVISNIYVMIYYVSVRYLCAHAHTTIQHATASLHEAEMADARQDMENRIRDFHVEALRSFRWL